MRDFIRRMLRAYDATCAREDVSIIDHGDPDAQFVRGPVMAGMTPAKPPASLARFASHYNADKHLAPNGEGIIDVAANRAVIETVMPLDQWRTLEASARRAHAQRGPFDYDTYA